MTSLTPVVAGALAAAAAYLAAGPRLSRTAAARTPMRASRGRTAPGPRVAPLAAVGSVVRRLLRRPTDRTQDRKADRLAGGAVVAIAATMLAGPMAGLALGTPIGLSIWWRRVRDRPRRLEVEDHIPELVALLELGVGAGLSLVAAIDAVTDAAPEPLRPDLAEVGKAIQGGVPAAEALSALRDRWGDGGRVLLRALDDHLRDGVSLLPSLERVAGEAATDRRRRAEARARRLPVLLLFPLVLCTLPAFGLLTVAPLVASTLGSLDVRPLEADASPTP